MFMAAPLYSVAVDSGALNLPIGTLAIGGVLLSSVLFAELQATLMAAGALIVAAVVLPASTPGLLLADWAGLISSLVTNSVIVVVYVYFRNQLERERQAALRQAYTDVQRVSQQVDAARAEIKHLYETAPVGLGLVDTNLCFLRVNEQLARFTGLPMEAHLGKHLREIVPALAPEIEPLFHQVLRTQAPVLDVEISGAALHGPKASWEVSYVPHFGPQEALVGVGVMVKDITSRKAMARDREELIKRLQHSNEELERFAYTVSHDLKAPLITIWGFSELLLDDAKKQNIARLEEDIGHIRRATQSMRRLLDDVLDLSRIGRVANPPRPVALSPLVKEACALHQGAIQAKGATVTVVPEMPTVMGDRSRLLELFQNLIGNALKFSGGARRPVIEVFARQAHPEVVVCVQDNGVGIDPRYHEEVFGLFNQLDKHQEGSGIGLAIAKRIVEAQGGRIWVESEGKDSGATFCVALPVAPATPSR